MTPKRLLKYTYNTLSTLKKTLNKHTIENQPTNTQSHPPKKTSSIQFNSTNSKQKLHQSNHTRYNQLYTNKQIFQKIFKKTLLQKPKIHQQNQTTHNPTYQNPLQHKTYQRTTLFQITHKPYYLHNLPKTQKHHP